MMRIVSEEEVMAGLRALPREGQNPGCKYTVISKVDGTAKHCGVDGADRHLHRG